MSRQNNDSTDNINCNSASKIDNLPSTGAGFSVTMWFMRTADGTTSGSFPRLIDKRDVSAADGWSMSLSKSTASPATAFSYNEVHASGNKSVLSTANQITDNIWYFLAFTVAAGTTATDVHIYLAAAGSVPAEVSYGTQTNGSGAYNSDAAREMGIGHIRNDLGASAFFTGLFSEVKIFGNKILTLNEIKGIMNGTPVPSPTAYWPLYGTASPEPDFTPTASNANIGTTGSSTNPPVSYPLIMR